MYTTGFHQGPVGMQQAGSDKIYPRTKRQDIFSPDQALGTYFRETAAIGRS